MLSKPLFLTLFASVALLALTGCADVQPVPYAGLSASSQMKRNRDDGKQNIPYLYAAPVIWSRYDQVVLDPVVVYEGSDNQFGTMKAADKIELANYMRDTFSQALSKRFDVLKQAAPGRLRIKLTLTGAETTTPFVGQFAHIDIGGNLYDGIQAMRGGKAAFGGSVSYAVEVYDSDSGELLKAYVSKQYPNAMNLPAAFGALAAAKTGLDKGADALVAQLH